jgi:hypothetical protein
MPQQVIEKISGEPKTGNEEDSGDDLRDALNKAADETEVEEGDSDETQAKKVPEKDDTVDDKKSDESDDEDDSDDEETLATQREQENALKFYRSITNPETAEQVLNSIAKRAGYELKSLNADQREAMVDEVEATLREALGDEYSLLPTGLSKALNRIINSKINRTATELEALKSRINANEEGLRKAAVDEALAWATTEYPEFESKNKKILKEMKQFPPTPNMNAREYIKKICKLADIAPKQSVDNSRSNRVQTNKDGAMPSDGVRKERSTKVANSLAEAAALAYEEQFPD